MPPRFTFDSLVKEPWSKVPYYTQIVSASVGSFALLTVLIPGLREWFAMIPGYIFSHYQFWTVLTCGFCEKNIIGVIIDVVGIAFFGYVFEPRWGPFECYKFLAILNVSIGVVMFFAFIILYYVSGQLHFLYSTSYGFGGVLAGAAMALTQIYPKIMIRSTSINSKMLPFTICLLALVYILLSHEYGTVLRLVVGIYSSWVYLRFFQYNGNFRGNDATDFSFASYFPNQMQPAVNSVSEVTYNLVGRHLDDQAEGQADVTVPPADEPLEDSKGKSKQDERRREKALKSLEERLKKMEEGLASGKRTKRTRKQKNQQITKEDIPKTEESPQVPESIERSPSELIVSASPPLPDQETIIRSLQPINVSSPAQPAESNDLEPPVTPFRDPSDRLGQAMMGDDVIDDQPPAMV